MGTLHKGLVEGVARRYRWLGWEKSRQHGLNQRVMKQDEPQNTSDLGKIYAAQRSILLRLVLPHREAFTRLINGLYGLRAVMSQGDRCRIDKIWSVLQDGTLTPEHINTARQIAHKLDVECGFPAFRELSEALSAARGYKKGGQK